MTFEHGLAYLDRFFIAENLDRFATPRYNAPRPVWYYLPIILGGLLPWSPFVLLWGPMIRRAFSDGNRSRDHRTAARVVGGGAACLLHRLLTAKQPRYILPILPPLAILLASAIRQQLATRHVSRVFAACVSVAGLLIVWHRPDPVPRAPPTQRMGCGLGVPRGWLDHRVRLRRASVPPPPVVGYLEHWPPRPLWSRSQPT